MSAQKKTKALKRRPSVVIDTESEDARQNILEHHLKTAICYLGCDGKEFPVRQSAAGYNDTWSSIGKPRPKDRGELENRLGDIVGRYVSSKEKSLSLQKMQDALTDVHNAAHDFLVFWSRLDIEQGFLLGNHEDPQNVGLKLMAGLPRAMMGIVILSSRALEGLPKKTGKRQPAIYPPRFPGASLYTPEHFLMERAWIEFNWFQGKPTILDRSNFAKRDRHSSEPFERFLEILFNWSEDAGAKKPPKSPYTFWEQARLTCSECEKRSGMD